jgi:hypothetical protein
MQILNEMKRLMNKYSMIWWIGKIAEMLNKADERTGKSRNLHLLQMWFKKKEKQNKAYKTLILLNL